MPPLYRKIGLYILENDSVIGFSSIHVFCESVGVSSATVVRFAKSLGLSGYADLKRSVQERIKTRIDTFDKIALSELDKEPLDLQLEKLRENEINNFTRTLNALDSGLLSRVVSAIVGAKRVFIAGFGLSSYVVRMFGDSITIILGKHVIQINGSISDYIPQLCDIGHDDALLIMTLPPYTREATHVAELGRSRKARILLFTDSPRCPAYSLADDIIHCESDSVLMANSYVGIVAVMQILLNLLCIRDKDDAASRLKALFALERAGYAHLSDIAAES